MSTTDTVNITAQRISEIVHDVLKPLQEPIFLQTRSAQVIAGIFVFTALFITCQQLHPNVCRRAHGAQTGVLLTLTLASAVLRRIYHRA